MSKRTDFENQAREYYQRHHMSETPHPRDVEAMATELRNAFVAGQESETVSLDDVERKSVALGDGIALKAYEETWTYDGDYRIGPSDPPFIDTRLEVYDPEETGVGRLAVQAPAMARLLITLSGQFRALDRGDDQADEIDAVLRAAGVLP